MPRLPKWMTLWLLLSTPVVLWDASFVLLRPHSFPDGSLGMFWSFGYTIYLQVDLGYADLQNRFVEVLAVISIAESLVVAFALWANYRQKTRLAHTLVAAVTALTGLKTILFFAVEPMYGWPSVGHNDWASLICFWLIPNGLWVVFPLTISALCIQRIRAAQ